MTPLPPSFFARPTLEVAPDLLGALLVHDDPEAGRLAGRIVETEAYTADDPAMHGWKATFGPDGFVRPVGRAADLFAAPGTAYVYKIYRVHWLLNVVTEPEGTAGAVLIRGVEPVEGEATMAERRPPSLSKRRDLTNGPGKLTQAFGIDGAFHGADLTRPPLFFAEDEASGQARSVGTSSRIGLSRGIERPYRFYVAGHPFVSPGEPSDGRVARKTKRRP
ncbi:MAG: DNA-3-methyladenine glycosylase [Rubricoccaceae bacterium]|nr:DNA-3-methyladenine glycosylase [Rubricoccaceae bacterium]